MDARLKEVIAARYEAWWARAQVVWPQTKRVRLEFRRMGATAGMAYYGPDSRVELHPDYCLSNAKDMVEDTIPHEIAHIVAHQIFGRQRIRPHGAEWQGIFMGLTGRVASRCHAYGKPEAAVARLARQVLADVQRKG